MKRKRKITPSIAVCVAPHVGAWIETMSDELMMQSYGVAPHVGAWIETLKGDFSGAVRCVAPHVGAWIETSSRANWSKSKNSRTSCRCVD